MPVSFFECSDFSSFGSTFSCVESGAFTVLNINIRSIRKYWDQFRIIFDCVKDVVDAFVLTEINVSAASTSQFTLAGYDNFFFTRPCGRGGGIGVYVRERLSASAFTVNFLHAEAVALTLDHKNFHTTLLSIYRPPSNNAIHFLAELSGFLDDLNVSSQVCLVGDFNIDVLNSSKSVVCDYLNLLAQFGFSS